MASPLDPWVVDFVAPSLTSKTRDRAFKLEDTSTGDNLEDRKNTDNQFFGVHEALTASPGSDINLSEWFERNNAMSKSGKVRQEERITEHTQRQDNEEADS